MKYLITGGTGSLGKNLVDRLLKNPDNIITVFSRNPHKQAEMKLRYHDKLSQLFFVLGDITDRDRLEYAMRGYDVLIHAAALKVVSNGESDRGEYFRVNSLGSMEVLRTWDNLNRGKKALFISTDKACEPINHYGKTKSIGEGLFVGAGYSAIRYGNVVESEGSFIHKWLKLIEDGNQPIELRLPFPTRFFLKMDEALDLIERVLDYPSGLYVPHGLKSFWIESIYRALNYEHYKYVDLLPGEKQHEVLIANGEKALIIDDMLSKVEYGYSDNNRDWSNSLTAEKLSGLELLKELGVR